MPEYYTSSFTGAQIDGAVGLLSTNIGTSGQVLTSNGSTVSWQNPSFTGSVSGISLVVSIGNNVLADLSGLNGQILGWNNGPTWQSPTYMTNPMTGVGDLIYGITGGTPNRLSPTADTGKTLQCVSGVPAWRYPDRFIPAYTTAPESASADTAIKIVVLNSEPAQRYDGYLYIILNSNNA